MAVRQNEKSHRRKVARDLENCRGERKRKRLARRVSLNRQLEDLQSRANDLNLLVCQYEFLWSQVLD